MKDLRSRPGKRSYVACRARTDSDGQGLTAASNGVAFDHGKTESAIFRRRKSPPMATVRVGDNDVPYNR